MRSSHRMLCLLLSVTALICLPSGCSKKSTRSCGERDLIAFLSDRSGDQYMLYTMQSDGTGQKMLEGAWLFLGPGRDPLVSPDGGKIVFAQAHKSHGWAMIVNADGSDLDTLIKDTFLSFVHLGEWSPDGGKLVYRLDSYADNSKSGVYVINPDGSGKVRLDEGYDPRFCGNDKVVYSRSDGIYIIGTNGEEKMRLQEALLGTGLQKPVGSPDRKKVAFCRGLVVPPPNEKCWLEIINPDSSEQTQLAQIDGLPWAAEIEFSPDSERILLLVSGEFFLQLYVVNIDGSDLRLLVEGATLGQRARWSPDGSRIVFTSTKDGNPEIYTVNASGPPVIKRLTNNLADDCNPDW
ncbi:MAG: PD40 domain-containing protein [Candidatus Zixiibacteriota bacterium]|nr:MAG: PD40 domain-containing protein [candidate division Zixibacteria bacterium]